MAGEFRAVLWLDGLRVWGTAPRDARWADFDWEGNALRTSTGLSASDLSAMAELAGAARRPDALIDGEDGLYIRIGELPEGGRSTNWATGEQERGVSAYEAVYDPVAGAYEAHGALPGALVQAAVSGRDAYLVGGREVGRGSDGEPLVTDVRVIRRLDRAGSSICVFE